MEPLLQFGFQGDFTLLLQEPFLAVFLTCLTPFFASGLKGFTIADNLCLNMGKSILELGFFKFALPDYDDEPSLGFKLPPRLLITFFVTNNFIGPELGICFWNSVFATSIVAVPEAAVNKNNGAELGEDNIRFAWEMLFVDTITEAKMPEGAAQSKLRLGGGGVTCSHISMALVRGSVISH